MDQVVVVGTSAGGREALRSLLVPFPGDFEVPILVVQHVGPWPSALPSFNRRSCSEVLPSAKQESDWRLEKATAGEW